MNKNAILEGLKEVARLALFAAISAVVAWATDKMSGLDPTSAYVAVGTVVLRFADKWIHENKNVDAKGIAPF